MKEAVLTVVRVSACGLNVVCNKSEPGTTSACFRLSLHKCHSLNTDKLGLESSRNITLDWPIPACLFNISQQQKLLPSPPKRTKRAPTDWRAPTKACISTSLRFVKATGRERMNKKKRNHSSDLWCDMKT